MVGSSKSVDGRAANRVAEWVAVAGKVVDSRVVESYPTPIAGKVGGQVVAFRVVVDSRVVDGRVVSRQPVVGRDSSRVVVGRVVSSNKVSNLYSTRRVLVPVIRRAQCREIMAHQHSTPDMVAPQNYSLAKSLCPQRSHSNTQTSLRASCRWARGPMSGIRDHN